MVKVTKKEMINRLYNYKKIKGEKLELELKYKEINDNLGPKAIAYGNEGTSYGTSNDTESQALKLADIKTKMNEFIKIKGIELARIENVLSVLDDREREIIESRYINNRSWESVASGQYLSSVRCREIAGKSLKKMLSILNYSI